MGYAVYDPSALIQAKLQNQQMDRQDRQNTINALIQGVGVVSNAYLKKRELDQEAPIKEAQGEYYKSLASEKKQETEFKKTQQDASTGLYNDIVNNYQKYNYPTRAAAEADALTLLDLSASNASVRSAYMTRVQGKIVSVPPDPPSAGQNTPRAKAPSVALRTYLSPEDVQAVKEITGREMDAPQYREISEPRRVEVGAPVRDFPPSDPNVSARQFTPDIGGQPAAISDEAFASLGRKKYQEKRDEITSDPTVMSPLRTWIANLNNDPNSPDAVAFRKGNLRVGFSYPESGKTVTRSWGVNGPSTTRR